MSEEQQHWLKLIQELQDAGVTLEKIAEHLLVSVRQVSNWKRGQRPTGMIAVRLTALHGQHRSILHGSVLHSAEGK